MTTPASPWLHAIRPQTIPASIGPVLLGTALAANSVAVDGVVLILAILCSVLLQIAVNLANDLFDGLAGIDTAERLGPPRMVQSGLISPKAMSLALAVCTALAMVVGILLAALTQWQLLWVGLFCVLAVFAYSAGPWPLASAGLGEVAVLAFFGWVAVAGSYWLQTGHISLMAIVYGTSAGLFSVAILLVNNIRDIPTDASTGKRTLAVRLGESASRKLFILALLVALVIHLIASSDQLWLALIPVVACLPWVAVLCRRVLTTHGRAMNALLATTARTGLIYCCCTAAVISLA